MVVKQIVVMPHCKIFLDLTCESRAKVSCAPFSDEQQKHRYCACRCLAFRFCSSWCEPTPTHVRPNRSITLYRTLSRGFREYLWPSAIVMPIGTYASMSNGNGMKSMAVGIVVW